MEVVQLEKFKRALKAQQTVAIHDLGENREMMAIERSADEMDQTGRSTEQEFGILGLNRRSQVLRDIQAVLRRIEERTFGTCTLHIAVAGLHETNPVANIPDRGSRPTFEWTGRRPPLIDHMNKFDEGHCLLQASLARCPLTRRIQQNPLHDLRGDGKKCTRKTPRINPIRSH